MLRRQARLRREYIYRKGVEERHKAMQDRKARLKNALEENKPIPTDLKKDALKYQKDEEWDDCGPDLVGLLGPDRAAAVEHEDDEYRWAGVQDPKIMVTTSRDPSSRLKMFAKEVRLLFPGAQRMNRGNYEMKQLVAACRANEVTDFIIVHEHRGQPDGLVVCHLPYGPTAYFTLMDVVMRHDISGLSSMSEQFPHLIFHNFHTKLGKRVTSILKYLFPVPKEDSRRIMTFINHDDHILYRHHVYKRTEGGKDLELMEVGPRFTMKLYQIKLGTLDQGEAADSEWVYAPFKNTAKKQMLLSDQEAFSQEQ